MLWFGRHQRLGWVLRDYIPPNVRFGRLSDNHFQSPVCGTALDLERKGNPAEL